MKLIRGASNEEIGAIRAQLDEGRRRPGSDDFLRGIPWATTGWNQVTISLDALRQFYRFWNGAAWGETTRRRHPEGV